MAAYGNCERGVHLALEMLSLSDDIALLTDGEELTASDQVSRAHLICVALLNGQGPLLLFCLPFSR